jgi:hypothetical protein
MPKPLTTRWVAGVAVAAFVILAIAAIWQTGAGGEWLPVLPASPAAGDPSDIGRRQHELRFLMGAFDRLESEAKQNPNSPALRSLRTEQEAVLERMREVARPLPRERLPGALPALLGGAPVTPAAAPDKAAKDEAPPVSQPSSVAPAPVAAASAAAPGELKPGLAAASSAPNVALSRDPGLNGVVLIARPRPRRPAPEATAENSADRQPVNPSGTGDAKSLPKAQATVRAPDNPGPAASGATERPPAGPVAILGR